MLLGGADGELKNCLQTHSSSPPAAGRLKLPDCGSMWLLWPEVEPLGPPSSDRGHRVANLAESATTLWSGPAPGATAPSAGQNRHTGLP